MMSSLVTPCILHCTALSRFMTPHDRSKCRRFLTSYAFGTHRSLDFRKRLSPRRIVNLDHTSLIASDLGYIAHLFGRFHGGGSDGLSPTNDVWNYSNTFPR